MLRYLALSLTQSVGCEVSCSKSAKLSLLLHNFFFFFKSDFMSVGFATVKQWLDEYMHTGSCDDCFR